MKHSKKLGPGYLKLDSQKLESLIQCFILIPVSQVPVCNMGIISPSQLMRLSDNKYRDIFEALRSCKAHEYDEACWEINCPSPEQGFSRVQPGRKEAT